MTEKLRPCLVRDNKAYFHKWVEKDIAIINNLSADALAEFLEEHEDVSHDILTSNGGYIPNNIGIEKFHIVVALVEYANGEVAEVTPRDVKFIV